MKEFETAAREAGTDVDEGTPFRVDGEELRAYKPQEGQMVMLMASTGRSASDEDRIAGVINFFVKVMNHHGAVYIENRLLDRDDEFGLEEVEGIMEWMIEEWSGHPTQEPSGSASSQKSVGQNSTLLTQQ